MSAQGTLISQALADAVGLNPIDLECLDLIRLRGRVTAGELAQHTGLTSGAVTGLIDRLERAGYVVREAHPSDRRRVYVRIKTRKAARLIAIYSPLQQAMERLCQRYSRAELELLIDFAEKSSAIAQEFIQGLQTTGRRKQSDRKQQESRKRREISGA